MARQLRPACMILGFVLLNAMQGGQVRGEDPPRPPWSPNAAAKYLDERAAWWLDWTSAARGRGTACVSCHTTLPFALARPALSGRLGETAPSVVERRLIDNVKKRVENWEKVVADVASDKDPFLPFYPARMKAPSLGTESVLNALVLVNHDARWANGALDKATQKALDHLWEQQQGDGAWLWLDFGLRPWEKEGAYFGASLAAVAVGTAGNDYSERAEVRAKVAAVKDYLRVQLPNQPLHHRVLGLWAASKLPGTLTEEEKKKLVEEVLSAQEADGGWSLPKLGRGASGRGEWASHGAHPAGAVSDGYATGLVVVALRAAGVAANDPRLRKGAVWLAAAQREGAWPTNYLNKPRNAQTDIGKFMRDAATGFAVLGLTESE